MTRSFHFSLPGCALAACLALSGHDAGAETITFDHSIGAVTSVEIYSSAASSYVDKMRGVYAEAGFDVAFDGYLEYNSGFFPPGPYPATALQDSLNGTISNRANLNDCRGCAYEFDGLDRITLSRPDGAPFSLQSMDIGGTISAWTNHITYIPENWPAAGAGNLVPTVPARVNNLRFTGTRSNGSTTTTTLSTFDGLIPWHNSYSPYKFPSVTLDMSRLGLTDLETLDIEMITEFLDLDQEHVDWLAAAYGFSDDVTRALSACIANPDPSHQWPECRATIAGLGRVRMDTYYETGSNYNQLTHITALHLSVDSGGTAPGPAPVPLPAGAGLITAALVSLGLLRRRPRAA